MRELATSERAWRALVIVQLGLVGLFAALTVARFPIWAPIDERAHFAYVETIAEDGRLPVITDPVSRQVQAITDGTYPKPSPRDPRQVGLAGKNYEAFQPPLAYALGAPVFGVSADFRAKIRWLRVLDLLLLACGIALAWRLARRLRPSDPLPPFAFALTVFLWPGVIVRMITVSNAPLELVLGLATLLACLAALDRRSPRLLVLVGLLLGLALLTRLTAVWLVPIAGAVVIEVVRRSPQRTSWGAAALAVALPALLLAPWVAFNQRHYGSLTASRQAIDQQRPQLDPQHECCPVTRLARDDASILDGIFPQEWKRYDGGVLGLAARIWAILALAVAPALGVGTLPRAERLRGYVLLAPLAVAVVLYSVVQTIADWHITEPRYLYAALPGAALLSYLGWRRVLGEARTLALCVAVSAGLGVAWAYLAWKYL